MDLSRSCEPRDDSTPTTHSGSQGTATMLLDGIGPKISASKVCFDDPSLATRSHE
jgi:hypothetical protein